MSMAPSAAITTTDPTTQLSDRTSAPLPAGGAIRFLLLPTIAFS